MFELFKKVSNQPVKWTEEDKKLATQYDEGTLPGFSQEELKNIEKSIQSFSKSEESKLSKDELIKAYFIMQIINMLNQLPTKVVKTAHKDIFDKIVQLKKEVPQGEGPSKNKY